MHTLRDTHHSQTVVQYRKSKKMEILKLISSLLIPIVLLVIGILINRKLERQKIDLTKEKEWHLKWAELFLDLALEYNKNVSVIICNLFDLQHCGDDE